MRILQLNELNVTFDKEDENMNVGNVLASRERKFNFYLSGAVG